MEINSAATLSSLGGTEGADDEVVLGVLSGAGEESAGEGDGDLAVDSKIGAGVCANEN